MSLLEQFQGHHSDMADHVQSFPETNWWVITGGPSSGKSWLIDELSFQGHHTIPEAARVLINRGISQGKTIDQIRADEIEFQLQTAELKSDLERRTPKDQLTYLERGNAGDSAVYLHLSRRPEGYFGLEDTTTEIDRWRYRGVFLLDRLPFKEDYARVEDEQQAARIHELLEWSYQWWLGYNVVKVPVLSLEERAKFVLDHVAKTSEAAETPGSRLHL